MSIEPHTVIYICWRAHSIIGHNAITYTLRSSLHIASQVHLYVVFFLFLYPVFIFFIYYIYTCVFSCVCLLLFMCLCVFSFLCLVFSFPCPLCPHCPPCPSCALCPGVQVFIVLLCVFLFLCGCCVCNVFRCSGCCCVWVL